MQNNSYIHKADVFGPCSHYLSSMFELWPLIKSPKGDELVRIYIPIIIIYCIGNEIC